MKTIPKFSFLILAALFLSTCGGGTDTTPTAGASISEAYTAAVLTLTAQASPATTTATIFPTATCTPTLWASPTAIPGTPTEQNASYSYSTANGCYNAAYVSDVSIPDGTVLAPGESYTKTWKLQNTGSCAWDEDFVLAFETGIEMDGEDTTIDESVAAGVTDSISVTLLAPETEGSYTGYWPYDHRQRRGLRAVCICPDRGIRRCSYNHTDSDTHLYAHGNLRRTGRH